MATTMTACEHSTAKRLRVCGAPCYYGGVAATRKYSKADLGWMWHCNRKTKDGARCARHRDVEVLPV